MPTIELDQSTTTQPKGLAQFFSGAGSQDARARESGIDFMGLRRAALHRESLELNNQRLRLDAKKSAIAFALNAARDLGGMATPEGKAAFQTVLANIGYPDEAREFGNLTANADAYNTAMAQERANLESTQATTEYRRGQTKVADALMPGQLQEQKLANRERKSNMRIADMLLPGQLEQQRADLDSKQAQADASRAGMQADMELLPGELRKQKADIAHSEAAAALMGRREGESDILRSKASIIGSMDRLGFSKQQIADFLSSGNISIDPEADAKAKANANASTDAEKPGKRGIGWYFDYGVNPLAARYREEIIRRGKARQEAFSTEGASYVDTGDGQSNLPQTYRDIGINDPDTAEQFQTLESMVGRSLPEGFDLRKDFARDPETYRQLLTAIKEGVPDSKNPGHKRKVTIQEILWVLLGD